MSRFIYPMRGLKTGHPGPLGWLFFWWLLIPIYLLWAVVAVAFFVVLLPVNLVRLFTAPKPKPPLYDVYTGRRLR